MSRVLLTFGDGRLAPALRRFRRQARDMRAYDRVISAGPADLETTFRRRYADVLRPEVRGFGYFCWKPQLIQQVLASLAPGDLLHYCDVGCHLNPAGRERLAEYFRIVAETAGGILAFRASPLPESFGPLAGANPFPDWVNAAWCKADTYAAFGLERDAAFLEGPIAVATTAFFRVSPESRSVVQAWRRAFMDDFTLIDDTPSRIPNAPSFIEHRHDQSLLSCLVYRHGLATLSNGEIELPRSGLGRGDWTVLGRYPIHARRDKQVSRVSRLLGSILRRWPPNPARPA